MSPPALQKQFAAWWQRYAALAMAAAFVLLFSTLAFLQHDTFHTRTYDLARFDQAIWNTLHGRFLFSSIRNMSLLGNHFSPFLALLSPLFLIWNDPKVLFLVQTVSIAATGHWLYKIIYRKRPHLAPWLLLAFYLNHAVHEITLFEFRRIVPAMPFLAMALYALQEKKRRMMILGLALALLCKENVGLIVSMFGLYLLLFERDWRWGLPIMLVGGIWVVTVCLWVIPAFGPPSDGPVTYPLLRYFDLEEYNYAQILNLFLQDPLFLIRPIFGIERLLALGRVFLPLGIVLPLLAPKWVLLILPCIAYMLMSNNPKMNQFEQWYLATVMPVLFGAIGVGLGRLSERWANRATALLLATTVVGYALYSRAPLGGAFDASLYRVTAHHRLAARIIDDVPDEARVTTGPRYTPHLAHREHIYHYPWIVGGLDNVDYVLLDRQSNPYPMTPQELNAKIDDMIADPFYIVEAEADGIYLLHRGGTPSPSIDIGAIAEGAMLLDRADIAIADPEGRFHLVTGETIEVTPGQQVRASLYWEALADPNAERTVSVRIANHTGALSAILDNQPGRGKRPTSWWKKGWQIRDVTYLTVAEDAPPGPGSLNVLLYDSYNHEPVLFDGNRDQIQIAQIEILPQ